MTPEAKLIFKEVCKTLNMPEESVLSKSHKASIVDVRYLCVHFIKKYTENIPLNTIGVWFKRKGNGSAHSFAIYALRKTEMYRESDNEFKEKYRQCLNAFMFYNKSVNFNNIPQY